MIEVRVEFGTLRPGRGPFLQQRLVALVRRVTLGA